MNVGGWIVVVFRLLATYFLKTFAYESLLSFLWMIWVRYSPALSNIHVQTLLEGADSFNLMVEICDQIALEGKQIIDIGVRQKHQRRISVISMTLKTRQRFYKRYRRRRSEKSLVKTPRGARFLLRPKLPLHGSLEGQPELRSIYTRTQEDHVGVLEQDLTFAEFAWALK
ncbi:hypothetical protein CEXT_785851 [Caerostris extrusa]|uniref:Uncharacterized protein n=1 Tax=Caerostris extrusa TaxID=172846 RepID=A0AAV4TT11_CAEEX|nr:hypothetical protein CEXT_785851 [Caerostris extrusa]